MRIDYNKGGLLTPGLIQPTRAGEKVSATA